MAQLCIKSYGVGVTTLEEVFLKVGDGIMPNDDFKEKRMSMTNEQANAEMKVEEYTIANECVEGSSLSVL